MHSGVLLWQSNFSNKAALDKHWNTEVVGPRHNNNELQRYSDDSFRFDNNELIITMTKNGNDIKSGRINTKGKLQIQYGYIEALIKFTGCKGLWPAFWMLGNSLHWPDCGEIDIMEYLGNSPTKIFGTVHGPGYSAGESISKNFFLSNSRFDTDFHIFGIEWDENRVNFYVDDMLYHSVTPEDVPGERVFNQSFYMILNVAVGGNLPGAPNGETPFPQEMLVDYIRVYE